MNVSIRASNIWVYKVIKVDEMEILGYEIYMH